MKSPKNKVDHQSSEELSIPEATIYSWHKKSVKTQEEKKHKEFKYVRDKMTPFLVCRQAAALT